MPPVDDPVWMLGPRPYGVIWVPTQTIILADGRLVKPDWSELWQVFPGVWSNAWTHMFIEVHNNYEATGYGILGGHLVYVPELGHVVNSRSGEMTWCRAGYRGGLWYEHEINDHDLQKSSVTVHIPNDTRHPYDGKRFPYGVVRPWRRPSVPLFG